MHPLQSDVGSRARHRAGRSRSRNWEGRSETRPWAPIQVHQQVRWPLSRRPLRRIQGVGENYFNRRASVANRRFGVPRQTSISRYPERPRCAFVRTRERNAPPGAIGKSVTRFTPRRISCRGKSQCPGRAWTL